MNKLTVLENSSYYISLNNALVAAKSSFYASIFSYNLSDNQDDKLLVRNITKLICKKKKDGLDIKILLGIPFKPDNVTANELDMSNEMSFTILKSFGVPVALFKHSKYESSHAKYFIVDNEYVVVGSHNFSPRALGIGFDDSIGIMDKRIGRKVSSKFMSDWSRSFVPPKEKIVSFNTKNMSLTKAKKIKLTTPVLNDNSKVTILFDKIYFQSLLKNLKTANRSIDIIMFYFSYSSNDNHITKKIFDCIKAAIDRGVKIRCILDKDSPGDVYASYDINKKRFKMLKEIGVKVKYDQKDKVTHSKLVIIDQSKVLIGSHNWTNGSFEKTRDMSLLIESTSLANEYHRLYNKRFK